MPPPYKMLSTRPARVRPDSGRGRRTCSTTTWPLSVAELQDCRLPISWRRTALIVVLERESAHGYHSTGRSAAEFTLRDNAPAVNALARISHAFMSDPPAEFAAVRC